jgi:hypothetical protein
MRTVRTVPFQASALFRNRAVPREPSPQGLISEKPPRSGFRIAPNGRAAFHFAGVPFLASSSSPLPRERFIA